LKWESVLEVALKILERQKDYVPFTEWVWGGGSALSYRYGHRDSEYIDIFFRDAQLLTFFSPRVNEDLEEIAIKHNEMSHFIKVWIRDDAQIDFIVAPSLTEKPFTIEKVKGYEIQVETPWEIATKKLLYRSSDLKVRDVVDVVAVLRHKKDRDMLLKSSEVFAPKLREIRKRLALVEKEWDKGMSKLLVYDESLKSPSIVKELEDFLSRVPISKLREPEPPSRRRFRPPSL